MIARWPHPDSYRATYLRGRPDLVFGKDYRAREFCVRPYDNYFDGDELPYRRGKDCITIIRLSDGRKFYFPKHTAHFNSENTDNYARERLGLPPKPEWGAR